MHIMIMMIMMIMIENGNKTDSKKQVYAEHSIPRPVYVQSKEKNEGQMNRQDKGNAAEVDKSTIINLSRRQLGGSEVYVLSKGLKFIPTTNGVDVVKVKSDLVEWERRMRLKDYFYGKEKDDEPEEKPWLKKDSVFTPEPGRDKYLNSYIDK